MNCFTLIDNIEKISIASMEQLFNRIVRLLRRFLRGTTFALDSTIISTPEGYPGSGVTKRKKEENDLNSPPQIIHGFKLFILYEVKSRIPVSMTIVPANESDHNYFLSLVAKGIQNLGKGRIKVVVADRGFLNGAEMWSLKHQMGIDFVIPSRANMIVREDAIKLRSRYEQDKDMMSQWPYGKGLSGGYGVEGLLSYFDYNPQDKSVKDNKQTNGSPINAVVVTQWRGKNIMPGKEHVLLTSLATEGKAHVVAQQYRLRSLIENSGFRELKQASYVGCLPRRGGETAENAAYLHMMLCVMATALFFAFLVWRKKRAPQQSEGECLRQWRRNQSREDKKNILVVAGKGKYYYFYRVDELMELVGVEQRCQFHMRS
jgi:hypothetical protein